MNSILQSKRATPPLLIILALACFVFLSQAQAVVPAPDGGYPGGNTAEGENALFSLTDGHHNTAIGEQTLYLNLRGNYNTAIGFRALEHNTTGSFNTASGLQALDSNTTGNSNTANGYRVLFNNDTGSFNTASGFQALDSNTTGNSNTATGQHALGSNTTGNQNAANGAFALARNTTGLSNTANGYIALFFNTTGNNNVALGHGAGTHATTGSNNVYIGAETPGVAGESNACYIASISGQTSTNGIPVLINSSNKLGTLTSSKRFKEDIKPMATASEALLRLKPVTFRYKRDIDPAGTPQLGLVAEDVEKVNPDLVVRDKEGKPYSVRYDQVNAMLLNEFLKEHRKVEEQQAKIAGLDSKLARQEALIAQQQKEFDATIGELKTEIQTVVAQLKGPDPKIEKVVAGIGDAGL